MGWHLKWWMCTLSEIDLAIIYEKWEYFGLRKWMFILLASIIWAFHIGYTVWDPIWLSLKLQSSMGTLPPASEEEPLQYNKMPNRKTWSMKSQKAQIHTNYKLQMKTTYIYRSNYTSWQEMTGHLCVDTDSKINISR